MDINPLIVLSYTSHVANLDVALGQRKLLAKAMRQLQKDSELACGHYLEARQCRFYTCNNKVLAKDGRLDEMLKKTEGIGALDDPLLAVGVTKSTKAGLDNDPQVFLGTTLSHLFCL